MTITMLALFTNCSRNKSGGAESETYAHHYSEVFSESSYLNWQANFPENWEVVDMDGQRVLHLIRAGSFGKIRRPSSYNILSSPDVTDFELTVEARCLEDTAVKGRDLCLFFGFQDSLHFYYTHVSNDVHIYHNMIGIVNGTDRVSIANTLDSPEKARLIDDQWHRIRVERKVDNGSIKVFIDDMEEPIHSITDSALTHGRVGLGSFDDFGLFRNFQLKYNLHNE
ncbi:MAG: hypothetical protein ABFS10_08915 [Bacteroidota bacterium]